MEAAHLIREFIAEAEEHFLTLEPNLLRLEKEPSNRELIDEIFLAAHSMKGTAAYVGLGHISNFTHALESLLEPLRAGEMLPSPEIIDVLLRGVDTLKALINHAAEGGAAPDTTEVVSQLNAWRDYLTQNTTTAPLKIRPQAIEPEDIAPIDLQGWDLEREDCEIFAEISRQQIELMRLTLEKLGALSKEDVSNPDEIQAQLGGMVKAFQKIRSSAGMLKVEELDEALAEPDRYFAALEPAEHQFTEEEVAGVARRLAMLETLVARFAAYGKEGVSSEPPPSTEVADSAVHAADMSRGRYTLRVDAARVDELLNLTGELVSSRARLVQIGRELKALYDDLRAGDLTGRQGGGLQRKKEARMFKQVKERLEETTGDLERLTNQMQEATMRIRMVPISQVLSQFPRMVRDLSRQAGKEVEIIIEGAETELDKTVIDLIGDPLIHLIRNAIDHGIEMPEERLSHGKTRQGRIRLCAYYEGNQVIITVQDDGRGLDLARIKQKAIQRGVIGAREAENVHEREAMGLIFASGLSTVEAVSSLSGRGVGLNVVKRYVEKINGSIDLESSMGKGCTFLIKLPLTLAIIPALMVRVRAEVFAIPLMSVEEAIRFGPQEMHRIAAQRVMRVRDRMVPFFALEDLLEMRGSDSPGYEAQEKSAPGEAVDEEEQGTNLYGVILRDGLREIGVLVDALFGEGDIVIKSLKHELLGVEGISGASIRGDGQVSLVIDAASVINLALTRVKQHGRFVSREIGMGRS